MKTKLTSEQFAEEMKRPFKVYKMEKDYDPEMFHVKADELICQLLKDLGYAKGIVIFEAATKYYA